LQLGHEPFEPGSKRRAGFIFVSPEAVELMKGAGRFYLWEGRFVGEASVVE
jgi:hypothetical protein